MINKLNKEALFSESVFGFWPEFDELQPQKRHLLPFAQQTCLVWVLLRHKTVPLVQHPVQQDPGPCLDSQVPQQYKYHTAIITNPVTCRNPSRPPANALSKLKNEQIMALNHSYLEEGKEFLSHPGAEDEWLPPSTPASGKHTDPTSPSSNSFPSSPCNTFNKQVKYKGTLQRVLQQHRILAILAPLLPAQHPHVCIHAAVPAAWPIFWFWAEMDACSSVQLQEADGEGINK